MNTLESLEQQLTENQSRVAGLIEQLERHGEISRSLEIAGHGLTETGERIASLAESTRGLVEATAKVISSLRETVELLGRADLERVGNSLDSISGRLDETHSETLRANQEAHQQIVEKHGDLTELLRAIEGEIKNSLGVAVEELSRTHMETTGKVRRIAIASLCIVALLLGLDVLQLFG